MSSIDKKLKRITVPIRIMLLLYENHKFVDQYEVPEQVSQNGIANELNLRQNHVSRALNELISEGLIFSRSSHVKGVFRRRRVYFLTRKGISEMEKFVQELSSKKILVRNLAGELREYTLKSIAEELRHHLGYPSTYHQILTKYYNGIEVDFSFLNKRKKTDENARLFKNLPVNKQFYGRTSETTEVVQTISELKSKIIIVISIAGQGKTTFLTHIISKIKDRPFLWTELNEYTRPSNIFNDWAYFLKENQKINLYNYLGSTAKLNLQDAVKMFVKDTIDLEPIIMIDDFHKAEPNVKKIFSLLKTQIIPENKISFIISSREKPGFYNRKDLKITKLVKEIELEGLDRESANMILLARGLPETELATAYKLTKGHPLALELYTPSFSLDSESSNLEFNTYLGEEILKDLSKPEIGVVKLASIFKRPVSSVAFFFDPAINQEILDRLSNKLILRKYQNGTYDIHDLIKSYFLNRMTGFEKQKFLSIASDYYSNSGSEKDLLDYLHILYESDRRDGFINAVLENSEFLLSQGYSQVGEYVSDINESEVSKIDRIRLLILKCDIALLEDKNNLARNHLKRGLELCDGLFQSKLKPKMKDDIVHLVSKIYNRSAEISKSEGRLDQTIIEHKKSIRLNRKYNNKSGEGKALNNLAIAYRERGELDLALESLEKAQKIFLNLNNQPALALVLVNIGDLYLLKKKYNKAMNYFQLAEGKALKNASINGLINRKLGLALIHLNKFSLAQKSFLKSIDAYREVKDLSNTIRNLNDLFICARRLDQKQVAERYLNTASNLIKERFKDYEDSSLRTELVMEQLRNQIVFSATWSKKELRKYIKRYIEFHSKNIGPKTTLEEIEKLKNELANEKIALNIFFKEMEPYFWQLEDKHPAIIVSIYRAEVLNELKRKKEINEIYKTIYPEAKRLKFGKAMRRIKELVK